ncbi:hypothetical protein BZA05DRAFT_449501 [Tricharina praecox]|uniref:uncharacterized protein n=1 Tax=Tricharina praecox TaxID=43433 RepID=UPI00221FC3F8|nr:uncharacterized protein BZA05DRAFT_449501 [Tricharina praecox]KAI5841621.1 hypothetical protein BZA05DRAFT_449501 [Tricharina praecox]
MPPAANICPFYLFHHIFGQQSTARNTCAYCDTGSAPGGLGIQFLPEGLLGPENLRPPVRLELAEIQAALLEMEAAGFHTPEVLQTINKPLPELEKLEIEAAECQPREPLQLEPLDTLHPEQQEVEEQAAILEMEAAECHPPALQQPETIDALNPEQQQLEMKAAERRPPALLQKMDQIKPEQEVKEEQAAMLEMGAGECHPPALPETIDKLHPQKEEEPAISEMAAGECHPQTLLQPEPIDTLYPVQLEEEVPAILIADGCGDGEVGTHGLRRDEDSEDEEWVHEDVSCEEGFEIVDGEGSGAEDSDDGWDHFEAVGDAVTIEMAGGGGFRGARMRGVMITGV